MVTPGYLAFHPNPRKPDYVPPDGACDSHCHVFGPGDLFPYSPTSSYIPVDAPKETLFQRHEFLGFDRAVLVQASCHGRDNSAMIDALKSRPETLRGVAIVGPEITEAELADMHEAGVRGVRFNFVKRLRARQTLEDRRAIVDKIAPLGWHVVIYAEPEDMEDVQPFIADLSLPVIFDHMGRIPVERGTGSPEFKVMERLLREDDKYWVKVSCPERLSKAGPPYDDVVEVAKALIEIASDRVLWGTDWPHPNMKSHIPDDGLLVDRIPVICPDETMQKKLLIDNPDRLYWS